MENEKLKVGRFYRHCDAFGAGNDEVFESTLEIFDDAVVDGNLIRVKRVKPVNEGLKVSDFSVGSLLASGNYDLLRSSVLLPSSNVQNADAIADVLNNTDFSKSE